MSRSCGWCWAACSVVGKTAHTEGKHFMAHFSLPVTDSSSDSDSSSTSKVNVHQAPLVCSALPPFPSLSLCVCVWVGGLGCTGK